MNTKIHFHDLTMGRNVSVMAQRAVLTLVTAMVDSRRPGNTWRLSLTAETHSRAVSSGTIEVKESPIETEVGLIVCPRELTISYIGRLEIENGKRSNLFTSLTSTMGPARQFHLTEELQEKMVDPLPPSIKELTAEERVMKTVLADLCRCIDQKWWSLLEVFEPIFHAYGISRRDSRAILEGMTTVGYLKKDGDGSHAEYSITLKGKRFCGHKK